MRYHPQRPGLRILCHYLFIALMGCLLLHSSRMQAGDLYLPDLVSMNKTDFGTKEIGMGVTHNFRLRNSGEGYVTVYGITITGPHASDFTLLNAYTPAYVAPDPIWGFHFDIMFSPTRGGARNAVVEVTTNDPTNAVMYIPITAYVTPDYPILSVYGAGPTWPILPSGSAASSFLGTVLTETQEPVLGQTIGSVRNTGGTPLSIDSVTVSGPGAASFVLFGGYPQTFPVILDRDEGLGLWAKVLPPVAGEYDATITIVAGSAVHYFDIRGVARPKASVTSNAGSPIPPGATTPTVTNDTDFDVVLVSGEQVVSTYTVKNDGSFPLSISAISKSGAHAADFTIAGITTPLTLGRGESTTFTLTFDPSAVGTRSASITIANDDVSASSYTFAVQGRGVNAGDLDVGFDPDSSQIVYAVAEQPDGKIVVGGIFGNMGGVTHTRLARINADGTVDSSFNPSVSSEVHAVLIQPDGKIVIAGEFGIVNGASHSRIARLNSDGTLDTSFTASASTHVHTLALQADGKILIGGEFGIVNGVTRSRIARLNTDGTLDTSFNPNASSTVRSIAVQPDGKIVVGGVFTQMGGVTNNRIARLNSDGTLDSTFSSGANSTVLAAAVQGDGKIVIGGLFTSVLGTTHARLARLNSDGSVDTGFIYGANDNIYGITLQADGKIFAYGHFTVMAGVARGRCARLNADGTLDTGINPGASSYVYGVAIQEDGRIVLVGQFTQVQSTTRNRIARLENNAATETLTKASSSRIEWLRGGSSPEAVFVSFELSTDGGSTWTSLGNGTRISGGWEATGLSLPSSGKIRARATTRGGKLSGSNGLVETILDF